MTAAVHNYSEGSPRNLVQAGSIRDIYMCSSSPSSHHRRSASTDAENDALDGLAREILDQWQDEANVRGLRERVPMTVPWQLEQGYGTGAGGKPSERVEADDLIARFKTLSPHQLVITGPAGAGKSSIAVLLVISVLEDREPGSGEAVPVVLSLSDWDPDIDLRTWVTRRVHEEYGGLVKGLEHDVVRSLVQSRRIVPVLDGFDELFPLIRERAARGLKQAFGSEDTLVLTSRPEAHQKAVDEVPFLRSVPVLCAHPVPPEAGRAYLSQMCHQNRAESWQSLFDAMENDPEGPVARTLSSPLMLWLTATVYASKDSDPRELLDATKLPAQADVEGHLLDSLIPSVSTLGPRPPHRPGPVQRWRPGKALTHFRFLAHELHRRRTQDIAWWQLQSRLTEPGVWGAVVIVAVAVLGTSASYAIAWLSALLGAAPPRPGLGILGVGQVLGAVAAVAVIATAFGRSVTRHLVSGFDERPRRPASGSRGPLLLAASAVTTTAVGAALPGSMAASLCLFALPLLSGVLLTRSAESDMAARPRQLSRAERRIALVESAVVASAVAVTTLAFFHWLNGKPLLITGGFVIAWSCSAAVLMALSRWGRWSATRLVLAWRRRLPRDVLGFLEEGRRLGVLRRVGAVYQFRHAVLRERLAAEALSGMPKGSGEPLEVVS
ncbi:NACHT domain-containing protein [Kitasatospora sp. NPDC059088]|uniref:NACHT domain-containing protein n=1 Tax=Kitasatospora sp. NPDC059088 TaxID=3346722 RepID=UPI0036BB0257